MPKKQELLNDSMRALKNTLKSLNSLIPSIVVVAFALGLVVVYVAGFHLAAMMSIAVIIVLFTAILIYVKSSNYSEASFSLVAGLLTVFSINWDFGKFVVFSVVWLGFTLFILIISSVRLAAKLEEIYVQAALTISAGNNVSSIEKKLRKIAGESGCKYLGPVDSARVIRLFCFRNLPDRMMTVAMQMVEAISAVTKLDPLMVADLVVDVYKAYEQLSVREYELALEKVHEAIREAPVSPEEFVHAFRESRPWILAKELSFDLYLDTLIKSFESAEPVILLMTDAVEKEKQVAFS